MSHDEDFTVKAKELAKDVWEKARIEQERVKEARREEKRRNRKFFYKDVVQKTKNKPKRKR